MNAIPIMSKFYTIYDRELKTYSYTLRHYYYLSLTFVDWLHRQEQYIFVQFVLRAPTVAQKLFIQISNLMLRKVK